MFTVLSNTRNSNSYVLAALAVMIAVLLTFAAVPAISAPRPILVPLTGSADTTSDYYQRHPELKAAAGVVADTTADFYLRHPEWTIVPAAVNAGAADYFQRHPELRLSVSSAVDMTGDFFLRHPAWTINPQGAAVPVTGMSGASDYFERHPELRTESPTVDLSDYFQRH